MANLSILIINKNIELNQKLTNFVVSLGYKVDTVISGNEGLDFIEKKKPTVVILSDNLTDLNAHDFIVKASQRKIMSQSTYVFITSEALGEMDKIKYMTLGFSYFLSTAFNSDSQKNLEWIVLEEQKLIAA